MKQNLTLTIFHVDFNDEFNEVVIIINSFIKHFQGLNSILRQVRKIGSKKRIMFLTNTDNYAYIFSTFSRNS